MREYILVRVVHEIYIAYILYYNIEVFVCSARTSVVMQLLCTPSLISYTGHTADFDEH